MDFQKRVHNLDSAVDLFLKNSTVMNKPSKKTFFDYKEKKKEYYFITVRSALKSLKDASLQLDGISSSLQEHRVISEIIELAQSMDANDIGNMKETLKKISGLYSGINARPQQEIKLEARLPIEILPGIESDIKELSRCFSSGCYRSAVMLCGRILETALFRKYFEETGIDLLEKAPGTGLGNLIAKLKEKNINLDNALSNQIHLINQVRVVSVHKKKEDFNPTRNQTYAIILYTIDSLEKLF